MAEVKAFLKDKLHLDVSDEKSGIHHAMDGALFLGHTIRAYTPDRIKRIRRKDTDRPVVIRDASQRIQLHVPHEKLAAFVERHRFGNYHEIRGEPRLELTNNSDLEILAYFNAVMRGLAEYYKLGVRWKEELSPVHHLWWYNLMKTLARKHKCSIGQLFGRVLTMKGRGDYGLWYDTSKGRRFMNVFTLKVVSSRSTPAWDIDRMVAHHHLTMARTDMVDRLRARTCEVCSQTDAPLEVHHVRRLKDVSERKLGVKIRAARARKRIAVCHDCHQAIHNGRLQERLDGIQV
jgi:Type II intron maturase